MHVTRDTDGSEIVVLPHDDPALLPKCGNAIVKVKLATGEVSCLLRLDPSLAVHITAPDPNGWVFIETYNPHNIEPSSPLWTVFTNEILQVKLDGTEVRRLLHHRSRITGYETQPRVSVSRDGTRFVFTSNFGFASRDVYLVMVDQTRGSEQTGHAEPN